MVPPAAAQAAAPDRTQAEPPPRLYIHIQDPSQRSGAEALRRALKGKTLAGRQIVTVTPVLDARSGVIAPQLRCVTRPDCAAAPKLADLLAQTLARPVRVFDLSLKYNGNTGTRPNHYEIWFDDGPIRVSDGTVAGATDATPAPVTPIGNVPPAVNPARPAYIAPRLPFPLSITHPAAVWENDIVTLNFTHPAAAPKSYAVTVDGVPAALRPITGGIEITVPTLRHDLFSRRQVPLDMTIGGRWHVDPQPGLTAASWLERSMGWILALLMACAFVTMWGIRGRKRARAYARHFDSPLPASASPLATPELGREAAGILSLAEPPEALVEACAHGDGLLFLGGEVQSLNGLPSHAAVLATLLDEATAISPDLKVESRALLARGDLDSVVDLLAQRLGRKQLIGELARCYSELSPPPDFVRVLPHIGFSGAISSGFARTVEAAWPKALHLTLRTKYDFSGLLREKKPFVLRLRGDLEEPASVILTGLELGRAIDETPGLRSVLSGLFASKSVLFAGMDAGTLSTALEMAGIRTAAGQRHFALIKDAPGFDISADRFLRQYGIEFIRIGTEDDATAFLGRLAARISGAQRFKPKSSDTRPAAADRATITHLRLHNIGPFVDLEVEFRKPWTMLLGNNGAGKSTILRAIALALSGDDMSVLEPGRPLLRRGEPLGTIELTVSTGRSQIKYVSTLTLVQGRLAISANSAPLQSGTIAAFGFPAMRGAIAPGRIDATRDETYPHPRVADVLPIIVGGVDDRGRGLKHWISWAYNRSLEPTLSLDEQKKSRAMIDSLFRLLDSMTPGFELSFVKCDPDTSEILLKTSDGIVPMDYISQGMSATIGWVGPVIQRLYEINGKDSRPEQQHAILLIDEIDSHLHPEWQQKLVDSLKTHFPNVQVIATTHSPLMVGNLGENEVLRVVRGETGLAIEYLDQSFIGYRFDQILTDEAFGLSRARSEQWTARQEYAALLGKSKRTPTEEAQFQRLAAEMRKLPGAAETPAERRAAEKAELDLQEALRAAGKTISEMGAGIKKDLGEPT